MDIVENAVHPKADKRFIALRLDMDIAGALIERILQEKLDRRNNMLVASLDLALRPHLDKLLKVRKVRSIHYFALGGNNRGTEPEEFPQDLEDVATGGKNLNRLDIPCLADVFDGPGVERVCLGKHHRPLFHPDGNDEILEGKRSRNVLGN